MTPSPEYRLLQQAIQFGAPAQALQEAQRLLMEQAINWPFFLDLAEYHAIRPQAAMLLSQVPNGLVPAEVIDQLNEAQREVALRQLANTAEFLHIHRHLKAAGITAVPYKGFWLAHTAYGHPAEREGGDVDLYIAAQDFAKVQKIMFALGYIPEMSSAGAAAEDILAYHGEYNFDKFEGEDHLFLFEFHVSVCNQKLGLNIQLADLEDHIVSLNFHGQIIAVFSPSAQLFLAALHHGAKEAWGTLKYVLDIGKLLKNCSDELDWVWLRQMSQRSDTTRLLWVGIGLAQALTRVKIPESVQSELSKTKVKKLIKNRLQALEQTSIYSEKRYHIYARKIWFLLNTHRLWSKRWGLILNHLQPTPLIDQGDESKELQGWLVRFLSRIQKIVLRVLNEKTHSAKP